LVAAFTEGAANDWISVAFVDGYDLPTWAGVLGFATFLSFMTLGRLVGASMLDRWGRTPVLRAMFIASGIGSLGVVFGTPALAYLGAAVWGFGVSLGFPVGMSAAADEPRHAAVRVSVVSTIAYGAFLIGPPGLGFLGDHWGVLRSLSVVSAMLLIALLALPAMRQPEGTRV
ncbi:MAG: MFS transporter, partial [Micrococcales bacterium]|nr:MFS transporter [Micrococcales bacterium]